MCGEGSHVNASSNLCPRCGTGILVPTAVGAPAGKSRLICPRCDGLPATTVGEVDLSALPGEGLSLGDLGAELGDLGFAPQPSLNAPPLLDDLLFGDDAPAATPPGRGPATQAVNPFA